MATRLFALGANGNLEGVIEGVGAANSAGVLNVSVDLATTTAYNPDGSTRAITKAEVVEGLNVLVQYIVRGNFPPA